MIHGRAGEFRESQPNVLCMIPSPHAGTCAHYCTIEYEQHLNLPVASVVMTSAGPYSVLINNGCIICVVSLVVKRRHTVQPNITSVMQEPIVRDTTGWYRFRSRQSALNVEVHETGYMAADMDIVV